MHQATTGDHRRSRTPSPRLGRHWRSTLSGAPPRRGSGPSTSVGGRRAEWTPCVVTSREVGRGFLGEAWQFQVGLVKLLIGCLRVFRESCERRNSIKSRGEFQSRSTHCYSVKAALGDPFVGFLYGSCILPQKDPIMPSSLAALDVPSWPASMGFHLPSQRHFRPGAPAFIAWRKRLRMEQIAQDR